MNHRHFVSTVIFLQLVAIAAHSQTYIFGRADFGVGDVPTFIAAGDLNGDGLTDLAVTNSNDNTVSVLMGKHDGTFAPQITFATGSEPVAIATGDFNGDGNLDLAVTNGNCTPSRNGPICNPSTVSILLGNGDGTFQPHIDYAVGTLPSSLVVADFNGDGKMDLAVTNANASTVSVLLGNGDGTFQAQVVYSTAFSFGWQQAVVGDFNGDGKIDLAVSCSSVVSVLLGNGDGTFQTHLDSGVGGIALAAGDFNQDGKLDLAVTGGISGLGVLLGNGDGTFFLNATYSGGFSVAVGDLNGDGKPDVVVSGAGSHNNLTSVSVLLGNGNGTFQAPVQYGTGYLPLGMIAADLNGDGKLDLAVANSQCMIQEQGSCTGQGGLPATISVLLGFGDGTFVGKSDYSTGGSPSITSADFNNDGNLDLATANQPQDSVSILLGNTGGTFQSQRSYSTASGPVWVTTADLRNNGIVDVVTANITCTNSPCNPGTVSVLLGNGNGTFQPHVDYGVALQPVSLAVGAFRGDGKLDLAVTNLGSGTVSILLGNGDGTFQPQVSYPTASSPQQIAIGDFNQDGKLDLAVTTTGGDGVSILLGNGDGTFKPHIDYPGGGWAIAVGDFNGDGKLDLAFADSVLLGNGDGTFQPPIAYSLGPGTFGVVYSIEVGDFNGDGRLDLAANRGAGDGGAAILLGNGDGTFGPATPYILANIDSQSLTLGDFNGDGVTDWAGTDVDGSTVGVMLSAAFKAISPSSLNFGSQGLGTTSAPKIITISNPSNVKFTIASITSSGNFVQTNSCGASLSPGGTCAVSVTFSPATTGQESGLITVTDSTRISPLAIALSGVGTTASDFTIGGASGSPTSQTISAGQDATFSLTIAPSGSFVGAVTLSCSLSPSVTPAPTCGLSTSSVQITGSGPQSVTVTVGTTAAVTTGTAIHVDFLSGTMWLAWMGILLGLGWLLLPNRKRTSIIAAPLMLVAMTAGCGGSGSSSHTTSGTPAGTYTATITAASGSLSHDTTFQVVVQ